MQATLPAKQPKRRRWVIYAVGGILLAAIFFLIISFVGRMRENRTAQQAQTGDIVTAFRGDLSASATASGHLESSQVANLSATSPGLIEEVYVQVGDRVQAGDALAQLDTDALALQVERAQQNLALREANLELMLGEATAEEITSAEAAVQSGQANLDNLLAGPSEQDIDESEANIRAQQANVASASASYNSTLESIGASTVASVEADLINAQIAYDEARRANEAFPIGSTHDALEDAAQNLTIAKTALDEVLAGPNQGSVNSAASTVSAAVANLEQAQANHESLLAGPTASQIAAAEASLAQARANLASLIDAASAEDITIAEIEVEQARLALQDAEELLAKSTITAPFDGLITAVYVAEGEYAAGDIVEITSDELKVALSVDEIDIGLLAPGQTAVISLEAWPDVEINGVVDSIAPSADNSANGVVTYDVQITIEETQLPVLVGMTANARLLTSRNEDVLLVPNAAITANREDGTYFVDLVVGEENGQPATKELEVVVGSKDKEFTHIISGLSEGDDVLIGKIVVPIQGFQGFEPGNGGPFEGD